MKNIYSANLGKIFPAIFLAHAAKMSENGFSKSLGQ